MTDLKIEPLKINRDGSFEIPGLTGQTTQDFRYLKYIGAPELAERLGGKLDPQAGLTDAEIQALAACTNYAQFRMTCDAIKHRRGGCYPSDWWQKMLASGLHASIMKQIDHPGNQDFTAQTRELIYPLLMGSK